MCPFDLLALRLILVCDSPKEVYCVVELLYYYIAVVNSFQTQFSYALPVSTFFRLVFLIVSEFFTSFSIAKLDQELFSSNGSFYTLNFA